MFRFVVGLALMTGVFGVWGQAVHGDDIIPFGAEWLYLNPQGAGEDPDVVDPRFDTNWFKPDFDTNRPNRWQGPAPEPFDRVADTATRPGVNAFDPSNRNFIREAQTKLTLPASGDRYSAYFRHEFTTDAPLSNLGIEFLVDDGAKIYLDGEEVVSHLCCVTADGDTIFENEFTQYTDLATGRGDETSYAVRGLLAGGTLQPGPHLLAVVVHQQSARDSDLGFSLRLFDGFLQSELIGTGAEWRFFPGREEPSGGTLDWATAPFDDSSWERGNEGFGYDANGDALPMIETVLEDMRDDEFNEDPYTSLYIRRPFTVEDATKLDLLRLTVDYDDGFIAYINGTEVARGSAGRSGNPLPFDGTASSHESTNANGDPGELFSIDLRDFPGLLQSGDNNVLAIHGLNTNLTSSDFVLAQLSLTAIGGVRGGATGRPGDFNGDGVLDATDIDLLSGAVRDGNTSALFDVNADGNVDAEDRRVWIEEVKNTWIGDANLDGQFGTNDFVQVFQAGEFEDNLVGNSTWATGDWNGDGEFGTGDFVAAFQAGGFEQGLRPGGPVAAVAAVPEPSSLVLILGGALGLLAARRRRG